MSVALEAGLGTWAIQVEPILKVSFGAAAWNPKLS